MAKAQVGVGVFTVSGTGNVTVRSDRLRGLKPKGYIVVMSRHATANDGAATSNAIISVGFTDGTTSVFACSTSESGAAATDVYRDQGTGSVLKFISLTGTTDTAATHSSFISGGCILNFGTFGVGATARGYVIFFAGDDVSCHVGTQGLGTGTTALDITAPGFQPDVVFALHANAANASAVENFFGLSFGIAVRDGSDTQAYVSWAEVDADAAGGNPAQNISTLYGLGQQNAGAASEAYHLTFGTFDANGFSVTPSASASSDDMNYLAVKLGTSVALVDIGTPTATGNTGYTSPGFQPQAVITVASNLEARDTPVYDSDLAGGLGICAFTATEEWGSAARIANADPSSTANETNAFSLIAPNGTATLTGVNASFVSMDATGFTLNYGQVEAAAKMAFALAIGEGDAVSLRPAAWHHRVQQGLS